MTRGPFPASKWQRTASRTISRRPSRSSASAKIDSPRARAVNPPSGASCTRKIQLVHFRLVLELGLDGEAVVLRHRGVAVGLRDLGAALVGAARGVAVAELEVGRGEHAVGVALVVGALEVVGQHPEHHAEDVDSGCCHYFPMMSLAMVCNCMFDVPS